MYSAVAADTILAFLPLIFEIFWAFSLPIFTNYPSTCPTIPLTATRSSTKCSFRLESLRPCARKRQNWCHQHIHVQAENDSKLLCDVLCFVGTEKQQKWCWLLAAAAVSIPPRTANHSASFSQKHQSKRAHLLHSAKSFPIHSCGWASGSGLLTFLFCYITLFFMRFIRTVFSRIAMYGTARVYICVCGRHGHRNESIYYHHSSKYNFWGLKDKQYFAHVYRCETNRSKYGYAQLNMHKNWFFKKKKKYWRK